MPDQLQVMNPAMVLFMMPVCPGGVWPVFPNLPPLHKMFIGGMLAALAFVSAGILQIGIERSTLQVPQHHHTGLILLNSLPCPVHVTIRGEGVASVEQQGTALMMPLQHRVHTLIATCPANCAGRALKRYVVKEKLSTVAAMFMPVVIGQNSDDQIAFYFMDPNVFAKSLTGKPKLKVVYIGNTGPNKNVSIAVETEKRLSDIYYVSDAPVDQIGESAYMCLQPGKFKWRASSAGDEVSGSGEGYLRAGGVYVLCLRERLGRLDAAVLHAPNPPNELHLAWIVPQYLLVSVAEIMFAVSGLEFSFTQAPKSMKTITIAAWYVSVAFGNLIVILVAQTKIFESRATEFFVYAAVLAVAMLTFLKMSRGFQSRGDNEDGSSTESRPLLRHRSRIFKGTRVSINEHPYVVSIRRLYSHYAMGCLLTRTVVISVAHPFVDVPVTDLGVVSGENYADRGHFLINVLFLVIHEDFDRTTLNADLALITTIRDIEFRNKVKPIMLIEPKKPIANKNAFVTGWGRCAQNGPEICLPRSSKYYPDEILDMMLMSISFQIKLPNRSCLVYKNNEVDFKPGMLCVGVARQVEPNCSCLGVPGAPLVVDSTLLGLQSWGLGCGYQHDLPLVYTDMMYYERWLVHNINILQLLRKSNLTTIIEATNSYIAALWLRTTRVIKPPSYMYVNKELEPMTFDKYIVKLKGTVYDIRNVIKEGAFSKMKQEMLEKLRKEEKMINYLRKDKTKIEVRPFLNKNIRVADVTDKVYDGLNDLIVEDDESDTDNVTNSVEEDTGDNY